MRTIMKFLALILIALAMVTSCTKEGPMGPSGSTGQNGIDGTNGADGVHGTDGQDGNANARSLSYDITGFYGRSHYQAVPEITQEVIDNDVILGYIDMRGFAYPTLSDEITTYPLPAEVFITAFSVRIQPSIVVGEYRIAISDAISGGPLEISGVLTGIFPKLKVIIIESSNSTAGKSKKTGVRNELKANGVDIKDYYQVMDYYGLNY